MTTRQRTQRQLEMMKDLLEALTVHGFKGISIPSSQRKHYTALEKDGLVYLVGGFGRGGNLSIRLTDTGVNWAQDSFAYGYKDLPQQGQTTWQDKNGNVTLVS